MKKSIKLMGVMACMSLMAVGAVAFATKGSGLNFGSKAATFEYDASLVTTRRIYFVNNDNGGTWYQNYHLQAQVWYSTNYSGFVDVHEIYGNYYYYVDFSSEVVGFLGGDLHFELRAETDTDTWVYTSTLHNVPALNKKSADVVFVNNNKGMSLGTVNVGDNTGIIASVLDHYRPCQGSYANGYNGYQQLKVDFLDPNATAITAYGDTTMCEEGNYSINHKIAELKAQYDKNGWTVAE